MTLGEKLKSARVNVELTQEQLAEKLMVSRSAIAKWENDKGMPDIDNLKNIASLLNISVDYLLDDANAIDVNMIREPIDLEKYRKSGKKVIDKDRILRDRYPYATISYLIADHSSKIDVAADWFLMLAFDALPGIPQALNEWKHIKEQYYLVDDKHSQYLVMIGEEFIETRTMTHKVENKFGKKFKIGNVKFRVQAKIRMSRGGQTPKRRLTLVSQASGV